MGSKSAQAAREAMAARVQNGELTASQAYALDKSGAFRKGYFEPYQEIAAKSKLGVWRNAPKADLKNAMSYKPSQEVDSKVVQRAKAAGVDPYGYSGVVQTPSTSSGPSGYALPGNGGDRQALEAERDILTRDLNATTNVALKNQYAARIEAINAEINKTYYPESKTAAPAQEAGVANFGFKNTSAGTGLPAPTNTYSADLQKLESEIDSLQQAAKQYKGTSAESGYIARIGELAMQASQMTAQQDPKKSEVYRQLHSDVVTNNTGSNSYIYADPYDYGDTLDQAYGQGFNSEREFAGADTQQAKVADGQRVMAERLAAVGIATAAIPAIIASGAGPAALLNPAAYGAGVAATGVTGAAATAAGAPVTAAGGGLVVPGMGGAAGTSAGTGLAAGATAAGATGAAGTAAAAGGAGVAGAGGAAAGAAGAAGGAAAAGAGAAGTAAANGLLGGLDAAGLASLIAGLGGAYTANEAGKAQAEAARYAADKAYTASQDALTLQEKQYNALMSREKDIYDQQRGDTQAWRTAGEQALGSLNNFERDNPVYKADPFKFDTNARSPAYNDAYNFRLSEGLKALQSSAAAKGMLRSGNTLQAITQYGQGMASQEVDNEFNRYQTDTMNKYNMSNSNRGQNLNRLQSLAGVGQTAVGQLGNAGQNYGNSAGQAGQSYANNAGNLMAAGAQAQGQGATGYASGQASGMVGASNALTNALSGYLTYDSRNRMNRSMYGGY